MMVPIQVIRWYRMQCYDGTDSCAIVVPIRRYCHFLKLKEKLSGKIVGKWDGMEDVVSALSYNVKNVVILLPQGIKKENVDAWLFVLQKELKERNVFLFSKNELAGISEISVSSDIVFSVGGYIARILYVVSYLKNIT